ncbi:hypothetical protein CAOG_00956 [Capsaspora owczarzaki ATCC 30864]|uniref:hypothetical protein n=1 Tax=Capsaspora owczarzaki (strain ATCC 30864) TaxID=595528 RepID=UPI0001FE256D|nr:hypothetical protein CAOG_00956 [Capsaspora owczarzaki ATCC 30864]|eukprot:XP_004365827.1 hypothetical protein CAOG_00956 [Capsaspora owczarzaki ATCC 30864]
MTTRGGYQLLQQQPEVQPDQREAFTLLYRLASFKKNSTLSIRDLQNDQIEFYQLILDQQRHVFLLNGNGFSCVPFPLGISRSVTGPTCVLQSDASVKPAGQMRISFGHSYSGIIATVVFYRWSAPNRIFVLENTYAIWQL